MSFSISLLLNAFDRMNPCEFLSYMRVNWVNFQILTQWHCYKQYCISTCEHTMRHKTKAPCISFRLSVRYLFTCHMEKHVLQCSTQRNQM